jgi:hypothetical protein
MNKVVSCSISKEDLARCRCNLLSVICEGRCCVRSVLSVVNAFGEQRRTIEMYSNHEHK